ncbi:hypothetical protein VPH35_062804 [Triticum aestivum]
MAEEAAAGGAMPFLPDEIIIWEILVHLDQKTLFRCRAYPRFLAFDHRAAADAQLHTVARFDKGFDLEASCDGLLVLSEFNHPTLSRTFSVCNPAMREHANLRLPPWDIIKTLGMYLHRPTGEYRLLLQRRSFIKGLPKHQTCCYILSLGSVDQSPRSIAWPETLSAYLLNLPARLHDSLHWHPKHDQSDSEPVVIVFDTIAESFRTMRAPFVPTNSYIFEMGDTLGFYSQSIATKYVDIWVLQNYDTEVWELKYRVKLPVAEIRRKFEGCDGYWNVDVVSVDGGVRLLIGGYGWLLHVDCDGKLIASFRRGRQSFCAPGARLKQSLIQHTFFPALDGYAMNASPFI